MRPIRHRQDLRHLQCVGTALLCLSIYMGVTTVQADDLLPRQWHTILAIHDAAVRWGVSPEYLQKIAWCESGMNMGVYNPASGAEGPFQFLPSTFYANADWIDRGKGPYNAWAAANVAAHMIRDGQAYLWSCS